MLKALAVVRTVFLIFIVGYTVRAMPWSPNVARTFDEQYARCSDALGLVIRACWLAIAWITLETILGWWMATRRRNESPPPELEREGAAKGREPPFAPPPV
jgi:hypothetical protein